MSLPERCPKCSVYEHVDPWLGGPISPWWEYIREFIGQTVPASGENGVKCCTCGYVYREPTAEKEKS